MIYGVNFQGRFEILSLSGSFMPNDSGGTRSRTGGMSVSLASPDGRVVGGGLGGLLVAASPVQVFLGYFPVQKAASFFNGNIKFRVFESTGGCRKFSSWH